MEARLVTELPAAGQWQFEPKWDGFRCLVFRQRWRGPAASQVRQAANTLFSRNCGRVATVKAERFVLDGELLIPVAKTSSFDALQMCLHPAKPALTGCRVSWDVTAQSNFMAGRMPMTP
jgi:ATP-dependent DNA ligase